MLALGTVDVVGEMVWMGESTYLDTTSRFACVVVNVLGAGCLREPTMQDTEMLMAIGA
jgi:hypothetical protein